MDQSAKPATDDKRKRVKVACNNCRRKRSRCGGPSNDGGSCRNCEECSQACTFTVRKEGRASRAKLEALEGKVNEYKKLLAEAVLGLEQSGESSQRGQGDKRDEEDVLSGQEDKVNVAHMIRQEVLGERLVCYLGDSSPFHMVPVLEREMGETSSAAATTAATPRRARPPTIASSSTATIPPLQEKRAGLDARSALRSAHPSLLRFSATYSSAIAIQGFIDNAWPNREMEAHLVNVYFAQPHLMHPLLCKSTFSKSLRDSDLKRRNPQWAALAFGVFAVASRYVNSDYLGEEEKYSCETIGTNFYNACRSLSHSTEGSGFSIEHTQAKLLMVIYLMGTHLANTIAWTSLGTVQRMLQSVGAHRKYTGSRLQWTSEEAQAWTRAWWVTYTIDRDQASIYGRPLAIRDDDFDVPPPTSSKDKAEGPGSAFLSGLVLEKITGQVLIAFYGPHTRNRQDLHEAAGDTIFRRFNDMLNDWHKTACPPLDYQQADNTALLQSSVMNTKFYACQLLIHRSSILSNNKEEQSNKSVIDSTGIVLNAAQGIASIMYNLLEREVLLAAGSFACCRTVEAICMLLILFVRAKKKRDSANVSTNNSIIKCMQVLRVLAQRWIFAANVLRMLEYLCLEIEIFPKTATSHEGTNDSSNNSDSNGAKTLQRFPSSSIRDESVSTPSNQYDLISSMESHFSTSIENTANGDLTSLFDFLCPGLDSFLMPTFAFPVLDQPSQSNMQAPINNYFYPQGF
ncbi:hypothetical protein CBS101457_002415 [Exobasidium rhododendri]|nr:hypothetical protein CBS101457_002415 [Exobasidium rhododendri]